MNIAAFRKALGSLLDKNQPGSTMESPGLCGSTMHCLDIEHWCIQNSYDMFQSLLSEDEYIERLGPMYLMTEDRWYFGQFVLSLSDAEMKEFIYAEFPKRIPF